MNTAKTIANRQRLETIRSLLGVLERANKDVIAIDEPEFAKLVEQGFRYGSLISRHKQWLTRHIAKMILEDKAK